MTTQKNSPDEFDDILDGMLRKIPDFNIQREVSKFYYGKIPPYLGQYFKPELKYVLDIAGEINPYLSSIRKNLIDSFKQNPQKAMKTSLEGLLFPSQEFKEELCSKVRESVEEVAYAAEIAAIEGYKIWEVKSNLPLIGKVAKGKLKKAIGQEDLPPFKYVKKEIEDFKQKAYDFLEYIGFNSDKKITRGDIRKRYQQRMKGFGYDDRRLLEYDYHEGLSSPRNSRENDEIFRKEVQREYEKKSRLGKLVNEETFSSYFQDKKRERQREFINSEYNSFWEKIISGIAYFFESIFG
jgi:hypothetical protein